MAVNQSHTENRQGAVIPFGESVLKQCPDVDLSFLQQPAGSDLFRGTKKGTLFLTSYRRASLLMSVCHFSPQVAGKDTLFLNYPSEKEVPLNLPS
uniref:WBP2 N-terminal like n=1 Tax=Catagonus wagneri TaxID=51154 RepID=A0A8C3X6A7_9CETA